MPSEPIVEAHTLAPAKMSGLETLGQSLASVAPTATPAMVAPLVLMSSGQFAWMAYALATVGMVAMAACINRFARERASAGSLFGFIHHEWGKWPSLLAGWALLIAYIGTGAAVTGGFTSYLLPFLPASVAPLQATLIGTIAVVAAAAVLAYRDVQVSARLMLGIEAISMALIVLLFLWPGPHSVVHADNAAWDWSQLHSDKLRSGLVLAIFSFVGFESAASMGAEARQPLRTIPRAILLTAVLSGSFFVLAAYAEGIQLDLKQLASDSAPLVQIAHRRQLGGLVPWLAIGSAISFFACTLACITAAARTAYALAHHRHLPSSWGRSHARHGTPHRSVLWAAGLTLLPALVLIVAGHSPIDIYGLLGTIATYGFLTAYVLITLAALLQAIRQPRHRLRGLLQAAVAGVVLVLAGWSAFDPDASGDYRWLPYIYLGLLALGLLGSALYPRWAAPPVSSGV